MFDLHYDLLTHILIRKNDKRGLKEYFYNVYNSNNITGGIFNLFYMTPEEMKNELNINFEDINIIKNLKDVNKIIKKNSLIPNNIQYIYGIEGLDYLENINDIDILYELGVRSVNIVWNNKNKFAGGAKSNEQGLTKLGEELVEKLIKTNIAIDLSHANEKSFYDILEVCKKYEQYSPIIFASHSNCKSIYNISRNLTDNQIKEIVKLNGVIGLVQVKKLCFNTDTDYSKIYMKHINHIKEITGNVNNIAIATDDMEYYKINCPTYKSSNIFNQKEIKNKIKELLIENNYTNLEINKILNFNFKNNILQRIKKHY